MYALLNIENTRLKAYLFVNVLYNECLFVLGFELLNI